MAFDTQYDCEPTYYKAYRDEQERIRENEGAEKGRLILIKLGLGILTIAALFSMP